MPVRGLNRRWGALYIVLPWASAGAQSTARLLEEMAQRPEDPDRAEAGIAEAGNPEPACRSDRGVSRLAGLRVPFQR
ncbi:hypothetical protein KRM28CT15_04220 [Krasilnikovia sp. M28-CT-15]